MPPARKPWDRRARESGPAFEAFKAYRDTPADERSLRDLADRLGKNRTLLERWSVKNDWQERVRAWDDEQDRQWQENVADERLRVARQHAQQAETLRDKAMAQARVGLEFKSAGDVARIFETATRVERQALGQGDVLHVEVVNSWLDEVVQLALKYMPPQAQAEFLRDLERAGSRL